MGSKRFLLVTANENETDALLEDKDFFKYEEIRSSIPEDVLFYNVGRFGKYDVVHFELPQQGSARTDSSFSSILTAIDYFRPNAVILVGVAFGKDNEKRKEPRQHIGDVLVSTMVADYESGKMKDGILKSDGAIAESGRHLISVFKHCFKTWHYDINGVPAVCEFGLILSGDKVVDDKDFKKELFNAYPRAIGGEMEGRGAYAACRRKNIGEWIIVKGICDWGDGTKGVDKKQRQITAATSAVSLLKHIFSNDVAFDKLPELKKSDPKPDSAAKYSAPNRQNRFHYSQQSAEFRGREEEIKQLNAFCGYDEDMHAKPGKPFSWWLVYGEGGSGKSRLCFEFALSMQDYGWSICFPPDHSEKTLWDCSEHLSNNTLFVLDYSEFDMGTIAPWLLRLSRLKGQTIRIRVLLIQRRGERIKKEMMEYTESNELKDSLYSNEFLNIPPLCEAALLSIITSYAKTVRQEELTEQDANTIYKKLMDIDETLLRPLYAQILTDAYCDYPEQMNLWCREDALDYICDKEEKEISRAIKDTFNERNTIDYQDIQEYGLRILCMAIMIGGMDIDTEFEMLLPEEAGYFNDKKIVRRDFFLLPQLFFINNGRTYCPALEPDIIGEYFVTRHWREYNDAKQLIGGAWNKPFYMSRFVTRLFQDHENFLSDEQKTLLCNVKIPEGVTSISDAFSGSIYLTSITLPNSIKFIGQYTFRGCQNLISITLSDSIESIVSNSFSGCSNLTSVTLSDSIVFIYYAFDDCYSITDVYIRGKLTPIIEDAFKMQSITFHKSK